tara:strand:+ start:343 stop:525 length:183 start_codon:yes stop_codon:yes gene_type:complete
MFKLRSLLKIAVQKRFPQTKVGQLRDSFGVLFTIRRFGGEKVFKRGAGKMSFHTVKTGIK